jgi:hypothetical protein
VFYRLTGGSPALTASGWIGRIRSLVYRIYFLKKLPEVSVKAEDAKKVSWLSMFKSVKIKPKLKKQTHFLWIVERLSASYSSSLPVIKVNICSRWRHFKPICSSTQGVLILWIIQEKLKRARALFTLI